MMKSKFLYILCFLLFASQTKAQLSNILIARNTVAKLQKAINDKQNEADQIKLINEGLNAIDKAKDDRKTKKWSETWAIKSYLSSYYILIEKDTTKTIKFINTTLTSIDTAKMLDKAGDNAQLTKAASYNVHMKMQDLGNLYFKNNHFSKSYNYLHRVSDYFPNDTTAAINTGISALKSKAGKSVINYFKKALNNGAKSPAIYLNLAKLYEDDAHGPEALDIIAEGLRKNPTNRDLIAYQINMFLEMGMQEEALNAIDYAFQIYNEDKLLYYLQGYLLQKKGNLDQAIASYKKAIQQDNYYLDPIYQLGLIYITKANQLVNSQSKDIEAYKENLNNAIVQMQLANEIEPDNKNTLQLLTKLYSQLNMQDKAQEYKTRLDNML